MNNLSVHVLIEMNILKLEDIMLDLPRDVLIINFYDNLEISILIYIKFIKVDIIIFSKTRKIIVSYIDMKISIYARRKLLRDLSANRDFIFELLQYNSLSCIIDYIILNIFVRNNFDHSIVLSRRIKLKKIVKYEA